MTHKTISVTMANDDAAALFEIGAAFQRIAQRHGLDVPEKVVERVKYACGDLSHTVERVVVDADKAQLAALGEEVADNTDVNTSVDLLVDTLDEVRGEMLSAEATDSPQLDADGLPWDARIHSDSRARNADDTWRARRKPKDMDEGEWATYVGDIRAELKRVMELPVEQEVAAVLDEPVVVVEPVEPEPIVVVPPPPAPAPVETVAPPAPVGELPTDFIGVLQWLTGNGWKSDVVDPVLARLSLGRLQDLQARPDMIPAFCDEVLKGV